MFYVHSSSLHYRHPTRHFHPQLACEGTEAERFGDLHKAAQPVGRGGGVRAAAVRPGPPPWLVSPLPSRRRGDLRAGNLPWGGEEVRGMAGLSCPDCQHMRRTSQGVINAEFGAISRVDNMFFWLLWKREKTELAERSQT